MSGKKRNTNPNSPKLFECEYITMVVGDDADVSNDLGGGDLLDLVRPVHEGCSSEPQTAIPTLSDGERKELRTLIRNVSTILFECDPMCINFDSNRDEYDPEAVSIVAMLKDKGTVDDAAQVIVDALMHWFDEDLSEYKTDTKWRSMAQRIWVACSEHQDGIKTDDS